MSRTLVADGREFHWSRAEAATSAPRSQKWPVFELHCPEEDSDRNCNLVRIGDDGGTRLYQVDPARGLDAPTVHADVPDGALRAFGTALLRYTGPSWQATEPGSGRVDPEVPIGPPGAGEPVILPGEPALGVVRVPEPDGARYWLVGLPFERCDGPDLDCDGRHGVRRCDPPAEPPQP